MTTSKRPSDDEKSCSNPLPLALEQAFSRVASGFQEHDPASLRSAAFNSATRPTDEFALRSSGDPLPIADSCNFYMIAKSFSQDSLADPLEVLDAKFRKIVPWSKLGSNLSGATDAIVFMQRPDREFVPDSDFRFVALDPQTYQGDAVRDRGSHQKYWDHQMNGRPFSMTFLKSGLSIWKKLGIKVDPETTAYMLQMKSIDPETSEAINAAIWSAFNTARRPIDLETAAFVLACFMHADPLRKHLVSNETFVEPYGDRTEYGLCKIQPSAGVDVGSKRSETPNDGDLTIPPGYLPVEADSARRQQIQAGMTNPEHLGSLSELKLLLASDAEKERVYLGTLGPESRVILDDLLQEAIGEIEDQHATVVGVVNVLITRMLDICVALRRNALGQIIRRR